MFQYKILLYSLDGRLLSTYRAYEWSLGIKSIAWSPSSQFLAIGSYDEKVRNRFIFCLLSKTLVELCRNSFVLQCFLEWGAYLEPCNLEEDHRVWASSNHCEHQNCKYGSKIVLCFYLYLKGASNSIVFWWPCFVIMCKWGLGNAVKIWGWKKNREIFSSLMEYACMILSALALTDLRWLISYASVFLL